ncbi:ATP-dependent RNA helicase DDX42 [Trichinella zimbabwensis]|uniref:RNA helicase n=1 Tax=Trichinella zimbabwensis TaxID=268475 RepID=A0A0V1HKC7_9BILA|nr:ATP-dependent RNA helicase DDX42 [Trichinella zimbabwensis]
MSDYHQSQFECAKMQYSRQIRKRRMRDYDENLEDADEAESTSSSQRKGGSNSDDEVDPLDAFMADVEKQAKRDKEISIENAKHSKVEKLTNSKLGRTDIEDEDEQESYFNWVEQNKDKLGKFSEVEEEDDIEYDDEGNPIYKRCKYIDPLPPIDHSQIDYEPFEKNFYIEHADIAKLTQPQVNELRAKMDIKVTGDRAPKLVTSFAHFGFDEKLMSLIRKYEFSQPTPIQAQGIPVVMSGRDVIGIAKTGSGKTAAYLWPAIYHIISQRHLDEKEGPICLIVVPTRELAIQVYNEAKKYGKYFDIRVICAYGGGSKWEQSKALAEGAEVVVCTPGRIIDLVKAKATNFERVTYFVLDEADRMFDLGFDRQCLMFSATFKKKIERLARDVLTNPVKIIQGEVGEANADIQQIVEYFASPPTKWTWLLGNLVKFCSMGKVLIFISQKVHVEEIAENLKAKDFHVCILHGDMLQHERNQVIHTFKKDDVPILIATDVAARGLDIPTIKTVINYDVAKDLDTHVHRIGRTGRAGEKGFAYTLVTDKDKEFAGHLVKSLESVNQEVPTALLSLAMQSAWFRKTRSNSVGGKKPGSVGGFGFGYKKGNSSDQANAQLQQSVKEASCSGNSDRLNSIKAAYANHYKSTFKPSANAPVMGTNQTTFTDPIPEWKKKLQAFQVAHEQQQQQQQQVEEGMKLIMNEEEQIFSSNPEASSFASGDDSTGQSTDEATKRRSRWNYVIPSLFVLHPLKLAAVLTVLEFNSHLSQGGRKMPL